MPDAPRFQAVSFTNESGQTLFGTLHHPEQARVGAPAIVLLSPGVKMRVGPGRLYVPLTEMLNSQGYTVLRFDFFGLGDSEGELQEPMLADVYNNIEVGRYVGDTLSAMGWLRRDHGFEKFILGGLCGGAITALLAAERESRVQGLLSLGMTVTLASNAATPAKYLTRHQLNELRQGYIRRLLQPKSWVRLLTLQSDYAVIWQSLRRMVTRERPATAASASASSGAEPQIEQRGNANPLFPQAFFAFLARGGRALMLFSEKDRLQAEYMEKFATPYEERLQPFQSQLQQHIVANANHVLSMREWQNEMVEVSRAWVRSLQGA
jgi:pimeloyl-ACP methyl ester carboxylesterase